MQNVFFHQTNKTQKNAALLHYLQYPNCLQFMFNLYITTSKLHYLLVRTILNNEIYRYEKTDTEKKTNKSIGDKQNKGNDVTRSRLEVAIKGFEVAMNK